MSSAREIRPYPWVALERLPRSALAPARALRQRFADLDARAVAATVGELLNSPVECVMHEAKTSPGPASGSCVRLDWHDGTRVWLAPDPALVLAIGSRLLRREHTLPKATDQVLAELAGVFAAFAAEAARRLHTPAQNVTPGMPEADTLPGITWTFTILFNNRSYPLAAHVGCAATPSARPFCPRPLTALDRLPIALPCVHSRVSLGADEFAQLAVGDVLLLGKPVPGKDGTEHDLVLCAPGAERGIGARVSRSAQIVIGEVLDLGWAAGSNMAQDTEFDGAIEESLNEAPVVLRVEVGQVTLSGREWRELRSGDVIELARRVAEPVILRVAGQEIARGELVDIEGELGVRIRELSKTEDG